MGALLGIMMSLSRIVENYILIYSDISITQASLLYFVEWLVVMVAYVWLVWRSSRRCALAADRRVGYSFGLAWSYVVLLSLLVGVVVGVANTLYVNAMGYAEYVEGMLGRLEQTHQLMLQAAPVGDEVDGMDEMYGQMRTAIRSAEQPSMFANILASMNNYIFMGGIMGLIIAFVVRRKPDYTASDEE